MELFKRIKQLYDKPLYDKLTGQGALKSPMNRKQRRGMFARVSASKSRTKTPRCYSLARQRRRKARRVRA